MKSVSKTVKRTQVGGYTIYLKDDGSLAIATTDKSRLKVVDMGKTKSNNGFVLVSPAS